MRELPRVRPHVAEYQLHTLSCAQCGQRTGASLEITEQALADLSPRGPAADRRPD